MCTRVLTLGGEPPIRLPRIESQVMPNQRDPQKKQLTVWRYEKDMDVLRQVAKDNNVNMSELMEILIEDFQDKRKAQQKSFLRNKRK